MKYYVYAGYYENFISGHKLPKPYTLRDEFKTFDEALDYVWENYEDDAIFFTEDVIGDAIDNGFINDENWEDYLMKESKKSARKSMKEQFVGKGEGGYRKPDKTKFNSGICLDSNGVKHTVIFDTHVEDFIVWVDDDNYLMWYVSSPQSLLNNLAESDLDENLILDIVALWEKLSKKHIKN